MTLLLFPCRTVHSIEHFSNQVNLQHSQEERVIADNVAMEIFTLKENSNTPVVRGFGTNSNKLTNQTVFRVTSIADVDLSNTEVAIILSDEVLSIAKKLEGWELELFLDSLIC